MIEQHIYHSFFKSILSERLSNRQWVSNVLLFLQFMKIVSILYYTFTKLIWFDGLHLVNSPMYHPFLLVPELLA